MSLLVNPILCPFILFIFTHSILYGKTMLSLIPCNKSYEYIKFIFLSLLSLSFDFVNICTTLCSDFLVSLMGVAENPIIGIS